MNFKKALSALKKGGFVVLFDSASREGEADLVLNAAFATPGKIALMRKDGGGLLCLAMDQNTAGKLGLPFAADMLSKTNSVKKMVLQKTAYGDKPAFSISVNHKNAFTGITDNDRALAAREFAGIAQANGFSRKEFMENFRTPGHLQLLIGRGIEKRRGHTELALRLNELAGLPPAVLLCEMLGVGKALSKQKAEAYALRHKIPFVEGFKIR